MTIYLPSTEWLALGKALQDKSMIPSSRPFDLWDAAVIEVGSGLHVCAGGKRYGPGTYKLEMDFDDVGE